MSTPFPLRLPLTVLLASALFACKGDDDSSGGGTVTPVNQSSLAGSWNYFQDGAGCDGEAFRALPLEVVELGGGSLELILGEGTETFVFQGSETESAVTFSGSSTAGNVTLEVDSAAWTIAENRNRLDGAFGFTRTVAGGAPCMFLGEVEIFRADATQTSVVRGDWEWSARTASVSGGCTEVGETQLFRASLWPKRQNQFVVELIEPGGERAVLEGTLSAARLSLSGTDELGTGDSFTLGAVSQLTFQAGGALGDGTLDVTTGSCSYIADLTSIRPAAGAPLLPFLQDVEGAQRIMGVNLESPAEAIELVNGIGSAQLGPGATSADVERLAEVVERQRPAGPGSTEVEAVRDALVYTTLGDIYWLDLAQRFDASGDRVTRPPVRVFTGNGAEVVDLDVFVDPASTTTVIVGTRASDRFMIELQAVAEVSASVLLSSTTEIVGMLLDGSGEYAGMATLSSSGVELRRLSVDQASALIATSVEDAHVTTNGSLFYARAGELLVVPAGESATSVLELNGGASYTLGRGDEDSVFVGRDTLAGASVLRATAAGVVELATTASVGAGGAAFSDFIAVGDRVVFSMQGGSGTRIVASVPLGGGTFETLVAAPDANDYALNGATAMGSSLYVSSMAPSVLGLDPTGGVGTTEALADFQLAASTQGDIFPAGASAQPEAIVMIGGSGEVRMLGRGMPVNGALSTASSVFSPATLGAAVEVAVYGAALLVTDDSATVAGDQATELYAISPGAPGAPVLVAGEAGELSVPLR